MCNTCNGFDWIIGLDGKLKRCPDCSKPRQVDWVEQEARIHELRLGVVEDEQAHDTSNEFQDQYPRDGSADGDVESEAVTVGPISAVSAVSANGAAGWVEWALQLAA